MAGYIIMGIVGVPILIMAIVLLCGKGAFLIAGYNTMGKAQQAKYDEKALCRFVGLILLGVLAGLAVLFAGIPWLAWAGIALILGCCVGGMFYIHIGKRFRNPDATEASPDGDKPATSRKGMIAVAAVCAAALAGTGVMLYMGEKDPAADVLADHLRIRAMYGETVYFTDITDITLMEQSMRQIGPGRRTNGYGGMGDALRGNFTSDELGEILLFVRLDASPTLCIRRAEGRDIYLSLRDAGRTRELYRELEGAWGP